MRLRHAALLPLFLLAGCAEPLARSRVGDDVYAALAVSPRVRVIVAFRDDENGVVRSLSERAQAVAARRDRTLAVLASSDFRPTAVWAVVNGMAGEITRTGVEALALHPDVFRVDLDVPIQAAMSESIPLVSADRLLDTGLTGRGITVAVLDTGADVRHPDLASSIVAEQCLCTGGTGSPCCPNGTAQQSGAGASQDDNGHGTNVTGILTSDGGVAPRGIAPDVGIVSVKILDNRGAGSASQIASGLDYILTQQPSVRIVNISLGTSGNLFTAACDTASSFTASFASGINALRARGTLVFASSLNNGSSTQLGAPACVANAVAVGAVYDAEAGPASLGCTDAVTAADRVACFSNSNSLVDMLAPGAPITSTGLGGATSTYLGTSQACPIAAGAAALLMEARPGAGAPQIENALKATGRSITDPKNGLALPRIDVGAALGAL